MCIEVGDSLNKSKEGFLGVYCEKTLKMCSPDIINSRYTNYFLLPFRVRYIAIPLYNQNWLCLLQSFHLLSISIFCYLLLCFLLRYLQFCDYFNKMLNVFCAKGVVFFVFLWHSTCGQNSANFCFFGQINFRRQRLWKTAKWQP